MIRVVWPRALRSKGKDLRARSEFEFRFFLLVVGERWSLKVWLEAPAEYRVQAFSIDPWEKSIEMERA
uniref:Uncharacterized protein n=1 Tax=Vespula pensylvanica TaxID=30213 RepID=A0A834P586_VESPE|nr:hypothetical protein H0235_005615 [Vespula pensylvanica]